MVIFGKRSPWNVVLLLNDSVFWLAFKPQIQSPIEANTVPSIVTK